MFNLYSVDKKKLVVSTEMPYFCEKYYEDNQKKCQNFYNEISNDAVSDGFYLCPYGFSCYKYNGQIYTCLIVNGHSDLTKVNVHLKTYKQGSKDFTSYTINQMRSIIGYIDEIEQKQKILRLTIHDLKNATKHFVDLVESVKLDQELSKKIGDNEELFSAIEGYSLIQYILDYHDQLLNNIAYANEKTYINFHKMIMKLSKLMQYRGRKKDVKIDFHGYTSNKFLCNSDLYLASFIFIENAIKYAEQFSCINIYFNDINTDITEVKIVNKCGNITEDEMRKIYNDGFRGKQAQVTSKGSGLGLGLAKRICDRSGVNLQTLYESKNQNEGEFIVKLKVYKDDTEGIENK